MTAESGAEKQRGIPKQAIIDIRERGRRFLPEGTLPHSFLRKTDKGRFEPEFYKRIQDNKSPSVLKRVRRNKSYPGPHR